MSRPHLKELLSKKEVDPAKEDTLEKGDFLALLIASKVNSASFVIIFVLFIIINLLSNNISI